MRNRALPREKKRERERRRRRKRERKKKFPWIFNDIVSMHRDDIVNTRVSLCATAIVDFSSACDLFEKMRTRGRQVRGGGGRGEAREKGSGVVKYAFPWVKTPVPRSRYTNEYWSTFAEPDAIFPDAFRVICPSPPLLFFSLSLSLSWHAGSRVRAESWNECRHRCMHRYSYLNCNLHSREDARETSRGRGKGKILVLEGILSGGKAVSFVVDWWRRVERLNVNVGSTNCTGKTLQSFSFFSRLSGIDWIFVISACE